MRPPPPPYDARDPEQLWALFKEFTVDPAQLEREMLALGDEAVALLTEKLAEDPHGWRAAKLLATFEAPAADAAIPALIHHMNAHSDASTRAWCARALGLLQRFDAFEPLFSSAAQRESTVLAQGLKAGRPASYPLLQRAFDEENRTLKGLLRSALQPGSASFDFSAAQVELVLTAMRSTHITLRRDAVCNSANVDKSAHKRLSPAVIAALADDDVHVRRLAVITLGRMGKRVLASAIEPVRALGQHPDSDLRIAVEYVLRKAKLA
jgi:HEAT repeat protein